MSWQVTEPTVNLWLSDSPLTYQPALGPQVGVQVYCKQRDQTPRNPRIFDIGCAYSTNSNWNLNWQNYLEVNDINCAAGETNGFNATLHPGDGGTRQYSYYIYSFVYDNSFDAESRTRIERLSPNAQTYVIVYPNGAKHYYTNQVTFAWGHYWVFRTAEVDPQGHAVLYQYSTVGDVVRLVSVTDADGHVNAVNYYDATTNLIKEIVDPFGRTNRYQHTPNGSLTNIIDMAGLGSTVAYDTHGWVTSLTTPYGATAFSYYGGTDGTVPNDNYVSRAVLVVEPNGDKQMFAFRGAGTDTGLLGNQIPTNTPLGTLDTVEVAYRNSFHWDQHQFAALSSQFFTWLVWWNLQDYNFWQLTPGDYLKARTSHWLTAPVSDTFVSGSVGLVREPSPDGVTPGPTTWFDYAGKSTNYVHRAGTNNVPSVIGKVLPDGTTSYSYSQYNPLLHPTNVSSTYSTTAGGVGTRAHSITYAAGLIDPLQVIGPDGAALTRYGVDTNYHLVTAETNAIGVTRYIYDAARRLTGTITPSGLHVTNYYYDTVADLNRLERSVVYDCVGGTPLATNSYTYYANGLVYTHTDERNLTTVNTWDALTRLTSTTYPDGTYLSNVYSRLDLTASRDRLGNWTYYGYDSVRRPTATTNALTQVTLTTYGPGGSPVVVSNAAGLTTMTYDCAGRLVTTIDPASNTVVNAYNAIGQLYSVTDTLGHSVTNWYNHQGLLFASSNAVGRVQQTVYDIYDRPVSVTDANGVTTTQIYDAAGRVLTRTYPTGGGVEQYGYTTNIAALTSYTNPIGNITRYAYDALGRKTNTVAGSGTADAVTNSFVYNAAGDLLTLRDGRGNATSAYYDAYGRVTSRRDANNTEISRYQYDFLNHVTNRWSAAKGTTTYVYDPMGNLRNTIFPNLTLEFTYDAVNRLTNMVDALGTTRYTYDNAGFLLTEDGPWPSDTVTCICLNRQRASLTLQQPGASGWSQTYGYDGANRLQTLVSPPGTFTYNYATGGGTLAQASRLPLRIDLPVGAIINSYDGMARVTNNILRNVAQTTLNAHAYAYNDASQRTRMTSTSAGNYVDYGYDALGQLTTASGHELSGGALRIQEQWGNTYDKAGNLAQRVKNQLTETFVADANDQLTSVSRSGTLTVAGTVTPTATQVTVNGQAATLYADKTFAMANVPLTTTTVTAAATDGAGHTATDNINLNATSIVGQFHYANLASPVVLAAGTAYYLVSQETAGGDQWYNWDTTVTTTTVATETTSVYGYGPGAWYPYSGPSHAYVPVDFKYVSGPAVTTSYVTTQTPGTPRNDWSGYVGMKVVVGATPVTVTALGRMMLSGNTNTHTVKLVRESDGMDVPGGSVSIAMGGGTATPQYDLNGNLLTDGWRTFTYDTDNQLVGIVVTNASGLITQTGFVYDGKSRRRIRTEATLQSGAWITNQVFRYVYDGQRVIQERDVNNSVLVTYTRGLDLSQTLDGAGGIGGLLARTHLGNKHFYYHADASGNVTAMVSAGQQVVAQYRYDPFGALISQSGPLADLNLYRFSSKEFHPPSGLYYFGRRFYDPNLQRWLNRDPSGTKDGPNLHAFCHNGPINALDAWGLDIISVTLSWAGSMKYGLPYLSTPELLQAGYTQKYLNSLDYSYGILAVDDDLIDKKYLLDPRKMIEEGMHGDEDFFGNLMMIHGALRITQAGLEAIFAQAVKKAPETLALVPKGIRSLGKWGEQRLAQVLGDAGIKPTKPFSTSLGPRFVDRLVDGIAHEAKGGLNVSLTGLIERQILKDAELIQSGQIQGAYWHFFQGAQAEVLECLTKYGIEYTVY